MSLSSPSPAPPTHSLLFAPILYYLYKYTIFYYVILYTIIYYTILIILPNRASGRQSVRIFGAKLAELQRLSAKEGGHDMPAPLLCTQGEKGAHSSSFEAAPGVKNGNNSKSKYLRER